MEKGEYLKKLYLAFGDFVFFSEDHHYEYKEKRVGTSVTRLIEEYAQNFDKELIAQKVATKENKTVEEVLEEWEEKNKWACEKGSSIHNYVQDLWKNNVTFYVYNDNYDKQKEEIIELIKEQAINFYEDYQDKLEHLADEFVIGSEEYNVASAVDHLFIDKETGGLVLVDYKTNSNIHKNEKYAKYMKAPLEHLKDTTLNHYFLQLSIYKYIIERYTDLKIQTMFIVYMSENLDNYEVIDIPYLEKEAGELLEWNIWN